MEQVRRQKLLCSLKMSKETRYGKNNGNWTKLDEKPEKRKNDHTVSVKYALEVMGT